MSRASKYVGRVLCTCLLLTAPATPGRGQDEGLIEGIASWADAVYGRTTAKWVGQRVPWPVPQPRPTSTGRLDSLLWPISVHMTRTPNASELRIAQQVLAQAEHAYALLTQAGLLEAHGDGGRGGTSQRDLYLVDRPTTQACVDADAHVSDLDSVHAFSLLDVRVPAQLRAACTARALLDAELLELDPAESPSVRAASAAYFAWLIDGGECRNAEQPAATLSQDLRDLLHAPDELSLWLRALGHQRDQNRGVFLQNMWHFARQSTWEGSELRGSPDLLEAIAKALELSHERLEDNAGALSNALALYLPIQWPPADRRAVRWSTLPSHLLPSAPLAPLAASFRLVDLEAARPGERLIVWARGEAGVRWALSATRLGADGTPLATTSAAVRKYPEAELQLELDADTRFVLVSVTNMAQGVPDPDLNDARFDRSVRLIVDRAR